MPKRRYNQMERDRSSSHDKKRKKKIKVKVDPSDSKMISLKEARMTAMKIKDLQSTKKIILGRESDQGEQEAERARKGRVSEATNNEMLGQVNLKKYTLSLSVHNQMKMKRVTTPPFLMYSKK